MNIEQISKELAEILPSLKSMSDKVKGIEATDAQVKELVDRCKKLEGTFVDFGSQLRDVKAFQTRDYSKGMTDEQKVDFVKFCVGVYKAKSDPASVSIIKDVQDKYRAKGMVEGTTTAGGYLIPTLFSKYIWTAALQESVALREAQLMPMTKGYKLPITRLGTDVSVSWENEAAEFDETTPVFSSADLEAKKLGAYTLISNELLEDEPMESMDDSGSSSVTDWLIKRFAEVMGAAIDEQVFTGTGSPFTGILTTTGVSQVLMDGGDWEFSDVNETYLSQMISLQKTSLLNGSKFYMSPTVLHYVRQIKDSQGRPIWQMPDGQAPATIYGYPYVVVDKLPSTSAAATPFMFFGNMKKFLIGTKGDMQIKVGQELKMLTDQTVLMVKRRVACLTALPSAFVVLKTSPSVS